MSHPRIGSGINQLLLLGARIFLATGISFGVVEAQFGTGGRDAVVGGLVFGLAMAIVVTAITAARRKDRGASVSPRQQTEVNVSGSLAEAQIRVRAALIGVGAKIVIDTPQRLQARTSANWWSWGENLSVDLSQTGTSTTAKIRSAPRMRMTLADYGRGHDVVTQVATALQT